MSRVRFLMVGGFLGAGKTTAIARLARHLIGAGRRVGLVTNDQADHLVDTRSLRAEGFHVGEVPGACFCCKFHDLVETAAGLRRERAPEIIIAEPVGSCTDLVATVIEPMRHFCGDQYEIAPLVVLLKPEHGQKILRRPQAGGFSPQAAYIFLKQIEEADIVVLNKIDKLSAAQRDELLQLVQDRFPEKEVLAASARYGDGFDGLVAAVGRTRIHARRALELDYEIYAAGEAELGWLNCRLNVQSRSGRPFALDDLLRRLAARMRHAFAQAGWETAHLKIMGQARGATAIANLVGSADDVELSVAAGVDAQQAELFVNARVAASPEQLEARIRKAIQEVARQLDLQVSISHMQSFRPARPEPTYRMAAKPRGP